MSEGKHTPGPWTVTDNSWEYSSVYGLSGELVAECPISSDTDEDTQDEFEEIKEANARLIAAAPDLLEALKHLMGWVDSWSPNFTEDDDWPEARHHIRAVISKAEGRS